MQTHTSQSILAHGTLKATEHTEEPMPVHNQSNIKVCLSFMYITSKKSTAKLKLALQPGRFAWNIDSVHGELCWVTWLQNQEASGLKQRLISSYQWWNDWCRTSSHGVSFVDRTANKTLPHIHLLEPLTTL